VDVEIWSDIACPWCYVGKRRFEAALAQFEHADQVRLTWRSFELDPDAPAERGGNRTEGLARKYGLTIERAREIEAHIIEVAAGEGLDFRFDLVRSGNTFDAHRLVHLAGEHGLSDAMKERLMRAYFTEGALVADRDTLAALADEAGLDAGAAREMLATDRCGPEVRADEKTAAGFGIMSVPTFVIDRAMGAAGAQPAEVMLEFLRRGWQKRPRIAMSADIEER
jgi:predicted DsbA family dithiol-disulfide isomerase